MYDVFSYSGEHYPIKCKKAFIRVSVQSVATPSVLIEFVSWHHQELTICCDPALSPDEKKSLAIRFIRIHHGTFRRAVEAYSTG
jgi:predicted metal-dependent hydrolase